MHPLMNKIVKKKIIIKPNKIIIIIITTKVIIISKYKCKMFKSDLCEPNRLKSNLKLIIYA